MMNAAPRRNFKVCLVSISLAQGGAERSCAMLSNMLEQQGHEVHIAVLTDAVDYEYSGTLFNLGLKKKDTESTIARFFRLNKLRKYLVAQAFDVVIDHRPKNDYSREVFYDRYIYRGLSRIYVTHSSRRDTYLTEHPEKFAGIANKNLANIAVSRHIEEQVLKPAGIRHTATIHNTFSPKWDNDTTALPQKYLEKNYVLFYGRIDDGVKDIIFLIRSFTSSKLWKQGIYLVLLGDGKDKKGLQEFCSHEESREFVLFEDFTSNPFPFIRHALFTTLTSKYEGFPMVLTESLSVGTPIVSLDIVSGPSEVIIPRKNGLLVRERSIPLFGDAMREMALDEKLRAHCASNAKASVASFSMEAIALRWDKLLQDAIR